MPEQGIEPPFNSQARLFTVAQEQLTSDDCYTPPSVFERMALTFDLDVSSPPGGLPWIPADRFYTMADDGLSQPWFGRVWMNPPYSHPSPWARRFITHAHGVALLPHSNSPWHVKLWDAADAWVVPPRFQFVAPLSLRNDRRISFPVFFAAFGEECVEAIGRLGPLRRVG